MVGNPLFLAIRLMVHHRSAYYFSLKQPLITFFGGRSSNGENTKGWYHGKWRFT
jgi:hypothetical protein